MLLPQEHPEEQGKEQEEEGIQGYLFVTVNMDTFNQRGKTFKPEVKERTKQNLLEINMQVP